MCGIAGIVSIGATRVDIPSALHKLASKISHRGLDDEGYVCFDNDTHLICGSTDTPATSWQSGYVYSPVQNIQKITGNFYIGLAHRRLSVIDVSPAGHQPMCSTDKRYWIVFNGEIYNFLTIRNELREKGHHFYSGSDTEVLLAAYSEWKEEMINHLDGMWAFAIYDDLEKKIFASRDRLGVKPFYYFSDKQYFVFASEQKAFTGLDFFTPTANGEAIFDYLFLGRTEIETEGFFKNIIELPPAHLLTFNVKTGDLQVKKYYELKYDPAYVSFNPKKFNEYVSEISPLVEEAVNSRLRSDAPIGACLSGGIDSSVIVCTTDKLIREGKSFTTKGNFRVFTSCIDDKTIGEEKWAEKVVQQTNTHWLKAYPDSQSWLESFEKLVYAQDIPFFGGSTFMHYHLMQLVKSEGIKVTVDGQGADELFAGYNHHFNALLAENMFQGDFSAVYESLAQSQNSFANRKDFYLYLFRYFSNQLLPSAKLLPFYRQNHLPYSCLRPEFIKKYSYRLSLQNKFLSLSLNKLLQLQATGPDLKVLLRASDRNSMAHSIEARTPFADSLPLIEKVFSIPGNYKIRNNTSKILLREASKRVLPPEIFSRKDKLGFNSSETQWLTEMKDELKPYISTQISGLIDTRTLLKNWDEIFARHPDQLQKLWRIINLSVWMKVFNITNID